jgi:dTDP-4-dehydrorhamnose reductase
MKILILGASGLVGSHLFAEAQKRGHRATGTYREQMSGNLLPFESSCIKGFSELLEQNKPDAVVDCCSWTWVDGCEREPEKAFRENAFQPGERARIAFERGVRYAYVSTSYVFRGEEEIHGEESKPNPLNSYGASKLEGENRIQEVTSRSSLIVRTMGVYGKERKRKNFLYQVHDSLTIGKPLQVPCDQFGNFTHAGDLATGILMLIESGMFGIWNVAGPNPMEKRSDIARKIAALYGLNEKLILDTPTSELAQEAARPRYAGLSTGKIASKLGFSPRGLEDTIPLE